MVCTQQQCDLPSASDVTILLLGDDTTIEVQDWDWEIVVHVDLNKGIMDAPAIDCPDSETGKFLCCPLLLLVVFSV